MEKRDDEIHGAADGSYKLTPSEPSAHDYQPGDEERTEGTDPTPGGDAPPAPVEAQPD